MELRVKGHSLGERVKEARDAANLSQRELAQQLGVAPRTVQYWEAGKVPRPKHRRALAAWLEQTELAA